MQRPELAGVDAVEAVHAAGVVDLVLGDIDAGGLALVLTLLAVLALFRVDDRAEHGETGEETQRGSHGADGVAVGASVLPGQHDHDDECDDGNDESGQAPQPYFLLIESVTAGPFGQGGEQVVHPDIHRLEEVLDDASPGAVRGQEGHQRLHTGDEGDDEEHPDAIAQPLHFGAVVVGLVVLLPAFAGDIEMRYPVLEHAQRADDGTIDAAEDKRQEDKADDDGHIEGQDGGEELHLGHPAQPSVQRSREVQEQQRDAQPEDDRQCDAEFLKHKSFYC